jgi:hypothetical protein
MRKKKKKCNSDAQNSKGPAPTTPDFDWLKI